jgi:hypothetical protein
MRIPAAAVPACAVVAIALTTMTAARSVREDDAFHRSELARLRTHFDSVLAELRGRDVANLDRNQRRTRAYLIRTLERYRDAGVFPHNHDFPGERVPYFRDEHGTLCAMAYLVAATGRSDLVDAIAAQRNNAYVPELATDPRLGAWLDSVGLTVAEAARIQPTYGRPPVVTPAPERAAERYVVPSLVLGLPALVTAVVNWNAPSERRPGGAFVIGAITGAASAILGAAILISDVDSDEADGVGAADLLVGSAAVAAVVRRSAQRRPRAAPPIASAESRLSFDVVPRASGRQLSPTAQVRIRF